MSCAEPSPPTPLPAGEGLLQLNFDANQVMVFWWQSTLLLGFVLGERLAYRLFRGDIA